MIHQALICAKMDLAQRSNENGELRMSCRQMEKFVCDLKLKVASLLESLDDKDAIIESLAASTANLKLKSSKR